MNATLSDIDGRAACARRARPYLPRVMAGLAYLVLVVLALAHPYTPRQPDPFAYRASIAALRDGHLTLTRAEYEALDLRLAQRADGGGVGIAQWRRTPTGEYASEKNAGYPFLVVPFDLLGATRLAPLLLGALGCLGLWLGARRWLGEWAGAYAVVLVCAQGAVLIMAYEAFMPSFTGAALVAGGLGLVLWALLAEDATARRRNVTGALGFASLGVAVAVRWTDLVVLVSVAVAVFVMRRPRRLPMRMLLGWWLGAAVPIALVVAYDLVVWHRPFSTGYRAQDVSFSLGAIGPNLARLPRGWLAGIPVCVVALAGVVRAAYRPRPGRRGDPAAEHRWVVAVLVASAAAVFALYLAYDWTTGFGPGTHYVVLTRFELPATGALALLGAYACARLPRLLVVAGLALMFAFGGWQLHRAATGGFLYTHDEAPTAVAFPPPGALIPPDSRR